MIHATDLIAKHVSADVDVSDAIAETCFVTGRVTRCIPRNRAISEAFTDMRFCNAPKSQYVSVNVAIAWKHGSYIPGKKRIFCPERQSCWYADNNEFRLLKRDDILELVLNGAQSVPWAGWATEKYRKHGSTRAQVNYSTFGIWGFDEEKPDCRDIRRVMEMFSAMQHFSDCGIGKKTLLYQNAPAYVIGKIGLETWMEFIRWSTPIRFSQLYKFLVYLLPVKGGSYDKPGDDERSED